MAGSYFKHHKYLYEIPNYRERCLSCALGESITSKLSLKFDRKLKQHYIIKIYIITAPMIMHHNAACVFFNHVIAKLHIRLGCTLSRRQYQYWYYIFRVLK